MSGVCERVSAVAGRRGERRVQLEAVGGGGARAGAHGAADVAQGHLLLGLRAQPAAVPEPEVAAGLPQLRAQPAPEPPGRRRRATGA